MSPTSFFCYSSPPNRSRMYAHIVNRILARGTPCLQGASPAANCNFHAIGYKV